MVHVLHINEYLIDEGTVMLLDIIRPAQYHGISASLQKWNMISRSHGNVTKSHGI